MSVKGGRGVTREKIMAKVSSDLSFLCVPGTSFLFIIRLTVLISEAITRRSRDVRLLHPWDSFCLVSAFCCLYLSGDQPERLGETS